MLDGQHRFAGLSLAIIELGKSIKLKNVIVFKKEDIPENEIPDLILRINYMVNQKQNDILEAYNHLPGFMQIIAKDNPAISYRTSKYHISVSNIIFTVVGARQAIVDGRVRQSISIESKVEYAKTFTNTDCLEIVTFLDWWKGVNSEILNYTNEKAKASR